MLSSLRSHRTLLRQAATPPSKLHRSTSETKKIPSMRVDGGCASKTRTPTPVPTPLHTHARFTQVHSDESSILMPTALVDFRKPDKPDRYGALPHASLALPCPSTHGACAAASLRDQTPQWTRPPDFANIARWLAGPQRVQISSSRRPLHPPASHSRRSYSVLQIGLLTDPTKKSPNASIRIVRIQWRGF